MNQIPNIEETYNTREVEEVVEDFVKGMWYVTGESQYPEGAEKKSYHQGFSDAVAMAYIELTGTPKSKGLIDKLLLSQQQKHREELQKARQDWLQEEIVRLEVEQEKYSMSGSAEYDLVTWQALQTIIDRYHSELDQDKQ